MILLLLVPLPWFLTRTRSRIAWPTLGAFRVVGQESRRCWSTIPVGLRVVAIVAMVVAPARPQTVGGRTRIAGQGVAIMAVLDHSPSMLAKKVTRIRWERRGGGRCRNRQLESPDSRPQRGRSAQFVEGRADDLIGLIVFANYPDRVSPPTLDHAFLLEKARAIEPARPGDQGTNIGDAIALALEDLHAALSGRRC